MENPFAPIIEKCESALNSADPQKSVEAVVLEAVKDPAVATAIAGRSKFSDLIDLAIHRSEHLTLLAGAVPPGFKAAPHNHNLWSVVGVAAGREDNRFFVRDGKGLKQTGETSVTAPDVLANGPDVIHAICNPLDTPLLVLHAYGGDLFGTPRSNWDPDTYEEIPFDWKKVRSSVPEE